MDKLHRFWKVYFAKGLTMEMICSIMLAENESFRLLYSDTCGLRVQSRMAGCHLKEHRRAVEVR